MPTPATNLNTDPSCQNQLSATLTAPGGHSATKQLVDFSKGDKVAALTPAQKEKGVLTETDGCVSISDLKQAAAKGSCRVDCSEAMSILGAFPHAPSP